MIRLAVRVRGDDSEGIVLSELLELSPAGVEEKALEDGVEYVIYGAPGELPTLPDVQTAVGDVFVDVSSEEIPDDWSERWKAWHRPVDVSWRFRRLRVRPPWEDPIADDPGLIELVVDPAQAFGTGAHATTRLCLELLLSLDPGGPFADWGSGTGVLAIAAARLGYAPVLAVDLDPYSIEASEVNAKENGVEIEVRRHNLRTTPPPYAPTVCANLVRPLLLDVAGLMERAPDHLICSGLLRHEADEVAAAFAAHGLAERDRRSVGEWSALLLTAASAPA